MSSVESTAERSFALPPVPSKKKIESYQDLLVWQKAMDLVELTHKIVAKLPLNEQYGLASQLRRAAGSVPANIAEGSGAGMPRNLFGFC